MKKCAGWAPNEKVALEFVIGASIAGARTLSAMKMVSMNVAADPLFSFAYSGVNGGIPLVTAVDPACIPHKTNRITASIIRV